MVNKPYIQKNSFEWRKNIEESIKDGLTMTTIYNYCNIFCTEGIKQTANNSISRCHRYHETC